MIYAGLLRLDYELLEVTDEAISLADVYMERLILTPKYYNDGLHIAMAICKRGRRLGELELQAHLTLR